MVVHAVKCVGACGIIIDVNGCTNMEDEFLTVNEVADYFRVDVRTIRRLCNIGEISAIRVGRDYRISRSALNKFIESQSAKKPEMSEE